VSVLPLVGPAVNFDHLRRLSDDGGLFEHAELTRPRTEHGHCVDDLARGLVVLSREPDPAQELRDLGDQYLGLVVDAQSRDGRFHNRLGPDGRWTDRPLVEDCWGRALWGLGTVAARSDDAPRARLALQHFERGAGHRSPHLRAEVFAALGAAEVLAVPRGHPPRLAVARAPAALRQRQPPRGAARRRVAAPGRPPAGRRAGDAGLVAGDRDQR
jgi:hypothetical protein